MRTDVARGITYSVLAGLAWAALCVTPPVARAPGVMLMASTPQGSMGPSASGSLVRAPVRVPTVTISPVIVNATRLKGPDTVALSGTIHSSLLSSLEHIAVGDLPKGQRRSLAWSLADIFEYRIDMSRDLDEGDKFHILVERLQKPNGKIIVNKILGVRLALRSHVFEAVYFKSPNSSSKWFDEKGKSLAASFLRAPLEFRRISSTFGMREHPLFGTWRHHTGTDYAAPMGTPVQAIGDGVVVSVGWMGGYGNAIDIRHSNGYVSRYGHMSRFVQGIHSGQHVSMGNTIGYVGMTGWATGPHLHFEIRVNGVAYDPKDVLKGKSGDPLPLSEAQLFQEIRAHTMAVLAGPKIGPERLASR